MSLLDNFPHTATAWIRSRTLDELGGSTDGLTQIFTGRACWSQAAGEGEILEFEKVGISVSTKIYFLSEPGLDERHVVQVTKPTTGQVDTYDVRSKASPDATAGMQVVWRVMAERRSTEA